MPVNNEVQGRGAHHEGNNTSAIDIVTRKWYLCISYERINATKCNQNVSGCYRRFRM